VDQEESFLARIAIIIHEGSPGPREVQLSRVLDFFGVPWKAIEASQLKQFDRSCLNYVVFGSIRTVAATLEHCHGAEPLPALPEALYGYVDDQPSLCLSALQAMLGDVNLSLQEAPSCNLPVSVSGELFNLAGPMAGLNLSLRLRSEDAVLTGAQAGRELSFEAVISVGNAPVFLRFQHNGSPVFLCTSSHMPDIEQPVGQGHYDVKNHFCSAVPLVMFIRSMFHEVAWKPQELGACLIIDDPLLRPRYGFCDFAKLLNHMRQHGFTTNIAFIPWNWRRTSPAGGAFFRTESGLFSVSIHGCDHTAGEFGASSFEVLHATARLAQSRMRNHKARTGIQHDPIMVFPQGVFSSLCPQVLMRTGFLAAVNTEVAPVDTPNTRTRIRDVWDVAIMTYGGFPIFTRRYASHGLENFAFDLLLGKPCLIVAHHGVFKDGGAELIELIEKINSLNCSLRWRPLGEVVQRACRRRANGAGAEEVEMYGNELLISNPTDQAIEVKIRKRTGKDDLVSEIHCNGKPLKWAVQLEQLVFSEHIPSREEKHFRVVYREQAPIEAVSRSLRFELSVALRRILSELRDDYLSKSSFLSATAHRLKNLYKKAQNA